MALMDHLRVAIHETHDRIEKLPFTLALSEGSLTRRAYLQLLHQLLVVHQELETQLAAHPELAAVYHPGMNREPLLRNDLHALGQEADEANSTLEPTLGLLQLIRESSQTCPFALLGTLYVFEGSRMGSAMLVKPLAACLGIPVETGVGLDYHYLGVEQRYPQWQRFKAAMNELSLAADQQDRVVAAAQQTMDTVYEIYAAIDPALGSTSDSLKSLSAS